MKKVIIIVLSFVIAALVSVAIILCVKKPTEQGGASQSDTTQSQNVVNHSHNFGEVDYTWNGDKCTATRECNKDVCTYKETETVTAVYEKDTDATCTVAEKGHYVATFTSNLIFEVQSTAVNSVTKGSPLGHSYGGWSFNETHHWRNATCCEEKTDYAEHSYAEDGWCSACKYKINATEGVVFAKSQDGTYAEVMSYNGSETKVNIASTYEGLPVTTIREKAFENNSSITQIFIPNSVTSIGEAAFSGCENLTSITIPDSVVNIGSYAFSECRWLKSAIIGYSVTSISEGMFSNCGLLQSVTLPYGLTSIGKNAFYYCDNLKEVILPNKVTSIGENAFYSCSALTSVTIGSSVTSIGKDAFFYCLSLTNVFYAGSVDDWNKLSIDMASAELKQETMYYYSETEPKKSADGTSYDGKYWHYVNYVPTEWKL